MDPYFQPLINAAQLQQTRQQTQFAKQEQPYHMQILQAQARQATTKADEMVADQKAMELARTTIQEAAKAGQKIGAADALEIGAETLAKAGRFDSASKILDRAELARQREQRTHVIEAQQAKLEDQRKQQTIEWLDAALGDVTDQIGLDKAIKNYESMTGEKVPEQMRVYSPEMIKSLRDATVKAKDRMTMQLRQAALDEKERQARERERAREEELKIKKARLGVSQAAQEIREKRETRLSKEGGGDKGKGSVVPPRAMTDHATSVIRQMFPEVPPDEIKQFARDAAADAMAEIRNNPGLDMKSAVYSAVQRHSSNIKTEIKSRFWGLAEPDKKHKYTGAGSSDKNPLPMPDSMDKLIPGKFYKDSKGVVRQWNPKG